MVPTFKTRFTAIRWLLGGLCVLLALGLGLLTGSPLRTAEETAPVSLPFPLDADSLRMSSHRQEQPFPETLPALARQAIAHYFATGQVLPTPDGIPPHWRRSAGVFVTVSTDRQPRGCWGSLEPSSGDLATATIRAAVGAVSRDWRYVPLRATELETASIQVAMVRRVVPIVSVEGVDPTRMGLFIRSGAQGAVLLPGEALTTEWQLSTARRWAGIPAGQPVELFRVEAELLHEF
ncbi:AMMECR1 domain-containing protein [Synechococcus sp. Nb3U1]|uniref:AMMECR1 domain-containing protein n=1 Tax=Synechococcus sp. Nb3U1 TaxID=1914529 RepID=UPI001F27A429|nr:AMMECR1 domain-containing protein [Synechococcus sp. Nb3U1]MCF2972688.1 AMMECR1 domain-containing protein [Synechococcus sp. Nb3U1]